MICSIVLSVYFLGQVSAIVIIMYWQKITGNSIPELPEDTRIEVVLMMVAASLLSWMTVWFVFNEDV